MKASQGQQERRDRRQQYSQNNGRAASDEDRAFSLPWFQAVGGHSNDHRVIAAESKIDKDNE